MTESGLIDHLWGQPELFKADRGKLEYSDVFPLIYIKLRLEREDGVYRHIKHLVIDEMQDYTPVQYAVLARLFPCNKTILGDVNQSLNAWTTSTAETISGLFGHSECVKLFKSYRSSYEITQFAHHIHEDDMNHDAGELSQEQVASLRALLEVLLVEVQRGLATSTNNARPVDLNLSIGRLTRIDALQQQHMAGAQKSRLQTQLAQIRQALAKISDGTYGECVRCEEPIGYARLRVRPETPLCIRCQEGLD